jgi:hypothetical protein
MQRVGHIANILIQSIVITAIGLVAAPLIVLALLIIGFARLRRRGQDENLDFEQNENSPMLDSCPSHSAAGIEAFAPHNLDHSLKTRVSL